MTNHPDTQAITAIRTGEIDRFRDLIERYERHVYAVAWARLGDATLAEDATQESFIRAYRLLGWLRDPARFAGWITRITRAVSINLGLRHRRELRRRERWSVDPVASANPLNDLASEDAAENSSVPSDALRAALADLPSRHRECLVLHYLEGRPVLEAAAALGITEGAFKVRLHRARHALRGRLERQLESSLGQLGPRRSLAPGIMASIALKTAASDPTGTGAGLLALVGAGFAKLIPLPLLFMLLPVAMVGVGVGAQSWATRAERKNYLDTAGFRRRLYDDDRLVNQRRGALWAVLVGVTVAPIIAFPDLYAAFAWIVLAFGAVGLVIALRHYHLDQSVHGFAAIVAFWPYLIVITVESQFYLPKWFLWAALALTGVLMIRYPLRRPLRFDYNLFLRERLRLLPETTLPSEAPSPLPFETLWAYARLGAREGLFTAYQRHPDGYRLRLRPVSVGAWDWVWPWPRRHDSTLTLRTDGTVGVTLGSRDAENLDRLEIRGTLDPETHHAAVRDAVQSSLSAFAQGDQALTLERLGHVPEATIFAIDPSRTGHARVQRLGGVLALIMALGMIATPLLTSRETVRRLRAVNYQPVPLSMADARERLASLGLGDSQGSRRRWDALHTALYSGYILPPFDWLSLEAREYLRTNSLREVTVDFLMQSPDQVLKFLEDWQRLKALHFGWPDTNALHEQTVSRHLSLRSEAEVGEGGSAHAEPGEGTSSLFVVPMLGSRTVATLHELRRAAPQLRTLLASASAEARSHCLMLELLPRIGADGTVLEPLMARWRVAILKDLGLLDVFDTEPLIELLASHQVLPGRPIPSGRNTALNRRIWNGLFRTHGVHPIEETYLALVLLEDLNAVFAIDREACIQGILRLHLGRGLFRAPYPWEVPFTRKPRRGEREESVTISADARATHAARESLRILGALERVPDLSEWEYRIHESCLSPGSPSARLGSAQWSVIEAVLLREAARDP